MCIIEIGRVHFCSRGISQVIGVVGDGGAAAATMANSNSYQLQPNCEMNVHWIWTSPFLPLRVGGINPVVCVVGDGGAAVATVALRRQQWLMRIHMAQLWNECAFNLDESIFALEGGGISPVVGVVGDGGNSGSPPTSAKSIRLFSHRRRVLCTPGYLANFLFLLKGWNQILAFAKWKIC